MTDTNKKRSDLDTMRHNADRGGLPTADPAADAAIGLGARAFGMDLREALAIAAVALARFYAHDQREPAPIPTTLPAEPAPDRPRSRSPRPRQITDTVVVYCAGCVGLQRLASDHRTALFKIGSTAGSLRTRLLELSAVGYAAKNAAGEDMPGFDDWTNVRVVARPSADPAIRVTRSFIEVELPAAMSAAMFEARLRGALRPFAFEGFADVRHDPQSGSRWTRQPVGTSSRATELYVFRPREDGDHLVAIIEQILEAARVQLSTVYNQRNPSDTRQGHVENDDELFALLSKFLACRREQITRPSGLMTRSRLSRTTIRPQSSASQRNAPS